MHVQGMELGEEPQGWPLSVQAVTIIVSSQPPQGAQLHH